MRQILYLDAARAELDAAVLGYRDHRTTGMAEMFLADIADAILPIAELPDAWPISKIDPRVRVRYPRRLRYGLFYVVNGDAVTIVAIAHTSRRPGYRLDRIR
ncbi:MAG TPA: type II toxin-antitoxin system RelE/ParE family toxin [Kofleriaceae bacterium]|jgi:plasmid stabilization system protein ParE|nr:type II toxin-antitoxin system RelE/ParE family toxin [Kofleriaceae bacterium]